MRHFVLASLFILASEPASAEPGNRNCDLVSADLLTDGKVCQAGDHSVVVATENSIGPMVESADAAAMNFAELFGAPIPKVSVIGRNDLTDAATRQLKDADYSVLPWTSDIQKADMRRASVMAQVKEQTAHLPQDLQDRALEKVMAQLGPVAEDAAVATPSVMELGAMSHELGHLMFRQWFDEQRSAEPGRFQYGSSAPDWLDEAFAVIMENETLKERRYKAHADRLAAGQGFSWTLPEYLEIEHPSLARVREMRDSGALPTEGRSRAIFLSGDEAKKFMARQDGKSSASFYSQTRLFIDYLHARSGSHAALVSIAKAMRERETFDSWLKTEAGQYGVPNDLGELEQDFEEWSREAVGATALS